MLVSIEHDINVGDLAHQLILQMSSKEIIEFIKDLDSFHQDWDVTVKLHKYFSDEVKKLSKKKGSKKIQEND